MVRFAWPVTAATILLCITAPALPAAGQSVPAPTPLPSAAPSPSASPQPVPTKKPRRLNVSIDSYTSGIDQQFVGPGIVPIDAPLFRTSGVPAPSTPYDYFSHDPLVTGNAIHQALIVTPTFALSKYLDVSVSGAYGSISGNGNVAAYWGDNLQPYLNPHLGYRAVQIPPAFPTHNGATDSVSNSRGSILGGALDLKNNGGQVIGALRGGWYDLHQAVPFVFAQPPSTNTEFSLVPSVRGSVAGDPPTYAALAFDAAPSLPVLGADLWAQVGLATVEGSTGYIASSPNAPAHVTAGSAVFDLGNDRMFKVAAVHLHTAGPDTRRVLFGANGVLVPTAYGPVPISTIYAQNETIVGGSAAFPVPLGADVELRYAWSCYGAAGVAVPTSSCVTGNYVFARVHKGFRGVDLAVEGVRFEPTFAPAVLSYGIPVENVWSSPFAYPLGSLNGEYQLVDTRDTAPNRQGLRLAAEFVFAKVDTNVRFATYQQVATSQLGNFLGAGFVEPYFLPQLGASTFGREQSIAVSFAWRPKFFGDVTLDLYDAIATRRAPTGAPTDAITMNYPSGVFSVARPLSPRFLGAAGLGRYAVDGAFEQSGAKNADLVENMIFAGLQYRTKTETAYGLEFRWISVHGIPAFVGAPAPEYHGPQVLFSQRFKT